LEVAEAQLESNSPLRAMKKPVQKPLSGAVDPWVAPCHIGRVKTKKPAPSESQPKSSGMKLVEKYRPRMSWLSDVERQKLMARGFQITSAQASSF
jgi:hypothetical protein